MSEFNCVKCVTHFTLGFEICPNGMNFRMNATTVTHTTSGVFDRVGRSRFAIPRKDTLRRASFLVKEAGVKHSRSRSPVGRYLQETQHVDRNFKL